MSKRGGRFRRLGPKTGDLFEHFGIESQAPLPRQDGGQRQVVTALACPDCGWFRAYPLLEPCLACGAPPRAHGEPASDADETVQAGDADAQEPAEDDADAEAASK